MLRPHSWVMTLKLGGAQRFSRDNAASEWLHGNLSLDSLPPVPLPLRVLWGRVTQGNCRALGFSSREDRFIADQGGGGQGRTLPLRRGLVDVLVCGAH